MKTTKRSKTSVFLYILICLSLTVRRSAAYPNYDKDEEAECKDYLCSELKSIYCLKRHEKTIVVHVQNVCNKEEVCTVNSNLTGFCIANQKDDIKIRYPGESCDPDNDIFGSDCKFGPRHCDRERKLCKGQGVGNTCRSSSDCQNGLFCGLGLCQKTRSVGDRCDTDADCGHTAFCYFSNLRNLHGVCTRYMGLKVGQKAAWKLSNGIWTHNDPHIFCETFYADVNGVCAEGFKSPNKGMLCEGNSDCENSIGEEFYCRCTYKGDEKYCDAGPEDDEWLEAREKFVKYLRGTQNCHAARGLDDCLRKDLFKDYKCAEIKAKYFVRLSDMPECLKSVKGGNSEFALYYKYCLDQEDGVDMEGVPRTPTEAFGAILMVWVTGLVILVGLNKRD